MFILSNALSERVDEGCLKLSNSLVKRLKEKLSEKAFVVTYERQSGLSDKHIKLNSFLLNFKLLKLIFKRREKVLYIPFPAKPFSTAVRVFVLSLFARWGLEVVWVMQSDMDKITTFLLKISGAKIIVFSDFSADYYGRLLGEKKVQYIKTGVDTKRFIPVTEDEAKSLKMKYGFDKDRPIILHVGHLNKGRNVDKLLKIDDRFQIVLVVSTETKNEQDKQLRAELESKENIHIIDYYLPDIQEIYQLADVYFFPVVEQGRCIDVPLSCFEAASCNTPVVATPFGEIKNLLHKEGFYPIENFEKDHLNSQILKALKDEKSKGRNSVLEYDWSNGISYF